MPFLPLAPLEAVNPRLSVSRVPKIMGILNVTPDSFYAGSRVHAVREAVARGLQMEQEGADVLDIGGESTRPGADRVSEEDECRRVLPVIEGLIGKVQIPLSIDTYKPGVARRAREAGAGILNDVTALAGDPGMPEVASNFSQVILMHMQGEPRTMQDRPQYKDVVEDILAFLRERIQKFVKAGGDEGSVLIDPGIGFGKNLEHNTEILGRLEEFFSLGRPVVIGASRKSFIGRLLAAGDTPVDPEDRLEGSLAVACRGAMAGVSMLRVHDVAATKRALTVFDAVRFRSREAKPVSTESGASRGRF